MTNTSTRKPATAGVSHLWKRDGAPRYVRQLGPRRVARITKVRRPAAWSWEATVTTALGQTFTVCREERFADCMNAFEECGRLGVTRYGRPFTIN